MSAGQRSSKPGIFYSTPKRSKTQEKKRVPHEGHLLLLGNKMITLGEEWCGAGQKCSAFSYSLLFKIDSPNAEIIAPMLARRVV